MTQSQSDACCMYLYNFFHCFHISCFHLLLSNWEFIYFQWPILSHFQFPSGLSLQLRIKCPLSLNVVITNIFTIILILYQMTVWKYCDTHFDEPTKNDLPTLQFTLALCNLTESFRSLFHCPAHNFTVSHSLIASFSATASSSENSQYTVQHKTRYYPLELVETKNRAKRNWKARNTT